uniref:Uncharacterized protein n=1 Tax=Glossina palpalis gambiensis TaxID=67801 RepID=A0A1B0AR67_9MUSC
MLPSGVEAIQHPERGDGITGPSILNINAQALILGIIYGNFGDLKLLLLEEFCRPPIDQFESKPQAESESESGKPLTPSKPKDDHDIESLGEFVVVEDANDDSFVVFWLFLMPLGGGIRFSSLLSISCVLLVWSSSLPIFSCSLSSSDANDANCASNQREDDECGDDDADGVGEDDWFLH